MVSARIASRSRFLRRVGALLLAASTASACKVSIGQGDGGGKTEQPDEAGPAVASATKPTIDAARMLADLETLSSDEYGGRYTFSKHLGMAADLLAKEYTQIGLAPVNGDDYRVPFTMPHGSRPGDALTMWVEPKGGTSTQVAGDVISSLSSGGKPAYAEVVNVPQFGMSKPNKVKGKIILTTSPDSADIAKKVTEAAARIEPAGLVLIGDRPPPNAEKIRGELDVPFPVAWLDHDKAEEWMGVKQVRMGVRVPEGTRMSMAAKDVPIMDDAFNVLAYIPGTEKPEEIVMLGAHYDHIGVPEAGVFCQQEGDDAICNGADDNASGTAMVVEIARAFTDAGIKPKRTVVFAHFAGEELGLHGSKALADKPPVAAPFDGGKIVAMVNLDMVGRLGKDGLAVGGVSSSDAWMPLFDELDTRDLPIVFERAINSRSDHASFYRHKVPVLFFFTGLHEQYHKAGDHFDLINKEGMTDIAQLVSDLMLELSDGRDVPYAKPRSGSEGMVSRMPGSDDKSVEKRVGADSK